MCKKSFPILRWMIKDLCLSGNELVAYAFLYDATKQGKEAYGDGYRLLTEVMNSTIPTTYNILKKLKDKSLIELKPGAGGEQMVIRMCAVSVS